MSQKTHKPAEPQLGDVSLEWDEVFGLHLQLRGGPEDADQLLEALAEAGFGARATCEGSERLRRVGCELVMLCAAERSESQERELRGFLLKNEYAVKPATGVACVPSPYSERLLPLLRRGNYFKGVNLPTASELELGAEDGPELLRMAVDPEFDRTWHSVAVWGPVWAWFLIVELKPLEGGPLLLGLLARLDSEDGDDAAVSILPRVFGLIGPEIAPALTMVLRDESRGLGSRWAAASGLREIALAQPDTRREMVAILTAQLEEQTVRDVEVNGAIIDVLLELRAVESAPVMERAFAARRVSEDVTGNWEHVQVELGLKPRPERPVGEETEDSFRQFFEGAESRAARKALQAPMDDLLANAVPAGTVRRTEPKVGRNDPCPCGSGKKFKKCCSG